jgi:hypothetical protein
LAQYHRKWAELVPHIESWLNNTVPSATAYTPVELLFGAERNDIFQNCLPKLPKGETKPEELHEKVTRAYERMIQRANNRKNKRKHGNVKWKPKVDDEFW